MPAYEEESIARVLAPMLAAALGDVHGRAVEVTGEGVHWKVSASVGDRRSSVDCFHYGNSSPFGPLPNQHLRSVSAGRAPTWRPGAEYYLTLEHGPSTRVIGRTRDASAAIDAVRRWLLGADLDELYREHAFLDEPKRSHLRLAHELEQALAPDPIDARVALESEYSDHCELWIYGANRSCRLAPLDGGTVACAPCIRTSQVATVQVADARAAAALLREWLADGCTLADVRRHHPTAELFAHAELLERGDVAGWSWANLLDRARASDSAAAYHRPLIEKIVHNPKVSSFFAFTSMHRLCFSRCSHFPFATEGMPIVWPLADQRYAVDVGERRCEGDVKDAMTAIERALAEVDQAPWHGVEAEALIAPINHQLATRGSSLRLSAWQRRQWLKVAVASVAGRVQVDAVQGEAYCELLLDAEPDKRRAQPRSAGEAAEQIIAWLEPG